MKRAGITLLVFLSVATAAAGATRAPVQLLTVVNAAGVSPQSLSRVERAIVEQVDQARTVWPSMHRVTFGSGGWNLALYTPENFKTYYPSLGVAEGFHYVRMGQPAAAVEASRGWSVYLSHEVLEMLADPDGHGQEIADPTAECHYRISGVPVSDFVTPKWFGDRHGRRLDWANALAPNGGLDTSLSGACVPIPTFNRHPDRYLVYTAPSS